MANGRSFPTIQASYSLLYNRAIPLIFFFNQAANVNQPCKNVVALISVPPLKFIFPPFKELTV